MLSRVTLETPRSVANGRYFADTSVAARLSSKYLPLRISNLYFRPLLNGQTDEMVRTSVLNDCLNAINNAEKAGKRQVLVRPSSKVITKFLSVMQKHGEYYSNPPLARSYPLFDGLGSITRRPSSLQYDNRPLSSRKIDAVWLL